MRSILIVGLGSIGRRHARVFRAAGIEEISGADLRQDRLDQARNEVGPAELTRDYKELLARKRFDAVLVTLPTAYHTPVIRDAVAAGTHVFVEKPVAHAPDGLAGIVAEAERKQLIAYTAYCYRFAPSAERMKAIVDSGRLGRVLSARLMISTYLPDWHPWEDYRGFYMARLDQGGGARLDESHGIDLLRWMFGDIASVSALVSKVSDLEIQADDLTTMTLRFRNGVVGEAHFDLLGRTPRVGAELIGSEGTLLWDRITGKIDVFDAATKQWAHEDFGPQSFVTCYDRQAAHFIDCVRNGGTPRTTLADGCKTLDVLVAALRSSNEGRVIKLPA
ncbi:MAG: Gfo/Idh/MocA family oxidoreductase [Alphaproteobacteria bacterium]|nr:Gfo/Idh/MocA family oxidoreductase [Alphaproteobacteria bacterium]